MKPKSTAPKGVKFSRATLLPGSVKISQVPNATRNREQAEVKPRTAPRPRQEGRFCTEGKIFIAGAIGLGVVIAGQILLSDRLYATFDKAMGRKTNPSIFPKSSTFFKPVSLKAQTQSPPPQTKPSVPRRLVFNLNISSPKDLKVKEGDAVAAGQVVAERVEEQGVLRSQRSALQLEYRQIQDRLIPTPQPPGRIPAVHRLPPISYAEEEAAIASTALNVKQLLRTYQQRQQNLSVPPIEESATVQRALVEVQSIERTLDNQRRKIDAVAGLKDLPQEVTAHEAEVLRRMEGELLQAQADLSQAQAKLTAAQNLRTENLLQIGTALETAKANHSVAKARLQTKKDQRAYTEYEASIQQAQRAEQQNQATQTYSRALTEALQQQRDRSFQLAQLSGKIADLDGKLKNLSVVTSPYTGVVRKIKILRQNDTELSAELTLDIGDGKPKPEPEPTPVPTTAPTPNAPPRTGSPTITKLDAPTSIATKQLSR